MSRRGKQRAHSNGDGRLPRGVRVHGRTFSAGPLPMAARPAPSIASDVTYCIGWGLSGDRLRWVLAAPLSVAALWALFWALDIKFIYTLF